MHCGCALDLIGLKSLLRSCSQPLDSFAFLQGHSPGTIPSSFLGEGGMGMAWCLSGKGALAGAQGIEGSQPL